MLGICLDMKDYNHAINFVDGKQPPPYIAPIYSLSEKIGLSIFLQSIYLNKKKKNWVNRFIRSSKVLNLMPYIYIYFFVLVPMPNEGVQLLYINLPKGGVLNNFTIKKIKIIKLKLKKNRTSFSFGQQVLFFFFFLTGLAGSTYHTSKLDLTHAYNQICTKKRKKKIKRPVF